MEKLHEIIVKLKTGRYVKVTASEIMVLDHTDLKIQVEVLIKEPKETAFRPLIGVCHPQYYKLKNLSPWQQKLLELQYAGIGKKQIQKILNEFKKIIIGMELIQTAALAISN